MGLSVPLVESAGSIKKFGGNAVPGGWLECDGSAVSRATYAALFAAIDTAFGVGDGSTTFNLPDFRGRAVIGSGTGAGLTARVRGQSGGAETHPLTQNENGTHAHGTFSSSNTGAAYAISGSGNGTLSVNGGNAGLGNAHNNMQPWGCATYIIKT